MPGWLLRACAGETDRTLLSGALKPEAARLASLVTTA